MKKTFMTMAAAAAVWGLVTLPATAQSSGSGSSGSGSSQQGGSASGSDATDQQGSSQGDQVGSGGTGQSGSGQTGTSGQSSGTGQSGSGAGSGSTAGQTGTTGSSTGTHAGSATSASAKGSSQDRTFIMEAAAGGMAEVELGRLASQKASSSEVKQFGQMMVDDHTKANDQLMKIAQTKGLAAPHALKPQDKATQDRLSKLSGEAFDRAYIQHMVQDHKKDVSLFRKQSTAASDAEVKQFASSTLPTLEKHLSRAQEIAQAVGGGSAGAKGTSGKATTTGAASGQSSGSKGSTGSKTTTGTKKSTTHGSGGSGSGGSGSGSGASGSGSSGSGTTPPQR